MTTGYRYRLGALETMGLPLGSGQSARGRGLDPPPVSRDRNRAGTGTYLPAGARHFRSRQAYDLAYETEHLDDRERAWRRVRKCRRQLGSDPDGTRRTLPREAGGDAAARYAYLLDRLDAAEDDLGLPLTPSGPRFAYR